MNPENQFITAKKQNPKKTGGSINTCGHHLGEKFMLHFSRFYTQRKAAHSLRCDGVLFDRLATLE
jgi:hypothetical protein